MVTAIVGANWGDEGKGKITDMLTAQSDIVVRFQGGNNAGHTIINPYGRFALHLLPSGVFYENVVNVIGPGVAMNIPAFLEEYNGLLESGVKPNIIISDRAQIVLELHKQFDSLEENRLGKNSFGSTKSGIAPFYSDKYSKVGVQVCELFDDESLKARIDMLCDRKDIMLLHMYGKEKIDRVALFNELKAQGESIKDLVCDTNVFMHEAVKADKNILLEGQLGTLKDPDHGIYPFCTSSSPLAGYAAVGAGVPPYSIKRIIAVVKAYSSAVGAGPFTSEIFDQEAHELRIRGGDKGEFGATTGRPRRVGWFDCVASRYGCMMQGATDVAFTLIDVLSYLDEIPVCVAYELDGKRIDYFPSTPTLNRCKPIIEKFPGWKCDIKGITDYNKLPKEARDYTEFVEKALQVPITMVSNGPRREDIIYR